MSLDSADGVTWQEENMCITDITSKGTSGHHSATKISGMRKVGVIMIEKILERLEEESHYSCSHCIERAIEIVQEVAKEYCNGWIPVEERLPENDDYVLCWYEYKIMDGTHVGEMAQTYGMGYYFERFNNWYGDVNNGVKSRVIAWMPLPIAPYQKGE